MSTKQPQWLKQKEEYYDKNPQQSFFKIEEGNNEIEIDMTYSPVVVPTTDKEKYPNDRIKYLLTNGVYLTVPIGLDRQIVQALMAGKTKINIVRIGTGKSSRYKVMP